MRICIICVLLFLILGLNAQNNYTQYVNPMIGTGGHGHTFPGATMPFAMVQLSPDTRIDGSWDGCSGYHYSDTFIYGFSHTHLSGTGCSDYGDIAFMPAFSVGKIAEHIEEIDTFAYPFSHKSEVSKPGYYSVVLEHGNIKVELTSTTRVGMQQYTYSRNGYTWITLNLKHRDELLEGKITEINKHSFSGLRRSKAWAENQLVYYYFELSRDAEQVIISTNEKGEAKVNLGYRVKAGDKILVKTALSSVDEAGAKANMYKELSHWNFEKVKKDANSAWNTELNRIKAYGGTKDEKINFYTALYHCMIHPNVMNDVDGRYMGRDKQIHKAEGFDYYTVFSLWDTYRALHPLLNIIDKKRSHDFIMTFKAQFEQSGRLPMWELWGNETNCMIGFHSVSVILDAYNKEVISLQELKNIYPAVKAEAMSNRFGVDKFREKGYLSIEDESESVSKTLEYSYDYYCVSEIAKELSIPGDGNYFRKLSKGWQNVYDVNTGFMRPRKNGGWLTPFDPKQVNNHYTEANAWQYSFAVPQEFWKINDIKKTSAIFNTDSKTTGREQSDISGMIGQYAQGNEPSHHIPYLFENIDSTAKYVKKIRNELYQLTPDGLCGNEDCGQMSAWYVFSAMGLYPVNPLSNELIFGEMLFDSVKMIKRNIYKNMKIAGSNNRMSAYLKANPSQFEEANQINLLADDIPVIIGFSEEIPPVFPDFLSGNIYCPSPIIDCKSNVFKDSILIEIKSNRRKFDIERDKALIFYKVNDDMFKPYQKSFYLKSYAIIKAIEVPEISSDINLFDRIINLDTSSAYFYKKPNNYTIQLNCTYNKQYTADGDDGLLDGLIGDTDWRKGRWQGYQSQDFEAIVDLQQVKTVNSIKLGCLQDSRSWILFPTATIFYGSNDGITFEEIKPVKNDVPDSNYTVQRKEFSVVGFSKQYRYIKVKALNYGKLPSWHQGAGGDAFIFVDEIVVD